jgi:tetratricopeptide (TPR) repeat protein
MLVVFFSVFACGFLLRRNSTWATSCGSEGRCQERASLPVPRVRLVFANGVCETSTRVTLLGNGGPVAEGMTNDQCEVDFFNVPKGNYQLRVSGRSFADADLSSINLDYVGPAEFEVLVSRPNELDRNYGAPGSPFVSTSDLGVPSRARKQVDKANELVDQQDWSHAIQKLNKAISIYPAYAVAYNNLGAIYYRLGDVVREREALEKAISLNDHFALAYTNLGRMNLVAGDFKEAQADLDKASAFDPTDPMTLILLSYVEFKQQRFDEAIATAPKAHALEKPHAFAHRVAARVFEQQGQGASAIAELELFLKEAPSAPGAEGARKELETVRAVVP